MKRVLFLCTGNYYRSRFAEIYFNWHAEHRGLSWRAESRGLALDVRNAGPISRHTSARLAASGISWAEYLRSPLAVSEQDFASADRIIACKAAEHQAMIAAKFPQWQDDVEYWHIDDLDCATPTQTFAQLEHQIAQLLANLTAVAA